MRVPNDVHAQRPWRVHQITADFRLEDVWELPGEGGAGDFPRLIELIASSEAGSGNAPSRLLWAIRWKLGELLGWDDEDTGLGVRVPTLRDRLPDDLRDGPTGPEFAALPFRPLFLTDDEFAAEIANKTVHGVMHVARVPDADDPTRFRAHMAVYVKPNGLFGEAYMLAIKPFRHLIVYPAMMREGARMWERLGHERPVAA